MKFGIVTIARVAIAVFLTVGVCATAQQFTEAPRYDSTSNVQGVVAGDFNRDGKPDVAFAACCYTLTIKLGNGDGTVGPRSPLPCMAPLSCRARSFRGPGRTLCICRRVSEGVSPNADL